MSDKELVSFELPAITTTYAMREDLAEVLEMYISALNEIQKYIEPISEKKAANVVFQAWLRAPCILLKKGAEIIGFAGLQSSIPEYTESVTLREYMFYIKPEHRSIKAAKTMSDAAQNVARELNIPLYMSHMVMGHKVSNKVNFLKRWGYNVLNIGVKYGK